MFKMASGKLFVLTLAVLAILTGYQVTTFYNTHNYEGDKAAQALTYVTNTNDLAQKAYYFQQSLDLLASYGGNPCWPFPTPDTNYTTIKASLQTTVENASQWSKLSPSDYAYQQAIINFNTAAKNIQNEILNTDACIGLNPYINPIGFGWPLVWLAAIVSAIIGGEKLDDYTKESREKKAAKQLEAKNAKLVEEHSKGLHESKPNYDCQSCHPR